MELRVGRFRWRTCYPRCPVASTPSPPIHPTSRFPLIFCIILICAGDDWERMPELRNTACQPGGWEMKKIMGFQQKERSTPDYVTELAVWISFMAPIVRYLGSPVSPFKMVRMVGEETSAGGAKKSNSTTDSVDGETGFCFNYIFSCFCRHLIIFQTELIRREMWR